MQSLQKQFAPNSICFGCGPANDLGLKINSHALSSTKATCEYTPLEHHQAFPGMVNGGILGTLLDCHSNWTAAWHLMNKNSLDAPPCTVTAHFNVSLKRPTPTGASLVINAEIKSSETDRALVVAEVRAGDKITATCEGFFVAVKEGHPAYHRWG